MGLATPTDEDLVSRSLQGDQDAFADLYQRYFDQVYDFIARMTRNQADAADVVQDTFMKILPGLETRPPHTSFKAWLFTVARNTAIDRLNRTRREVPIATEEYDQGEPYLFAHMSSPPAGDPERTLLDNELAALVWQAARGLTPQDYGLLDMSLRQGLEPEDIATALNTSRGNVYTMLSRLRNSLEESVTALLLTRRGRQDCSVLSDLLARRQITDALDPNARRAVNRHIASCDTCQGNRQRYASASAIFSGLAPVSAVPAFKSSLLADLTQQNATPSAAGPGSTGDR